MIINCFKQVSAVGGSYWPKIDQLQLQVEQLSVEMQEVLELLNALIEKTHDCCSQKRY